jgi:hypothetical protein
MAFLQALGSWESMSEMQHEQQPLLLQLDDEDSQLQYDGQLLLGY